VFYEAGKSSYTDGDTNQLVRGKNLNSPDPMFGIDHDIAQKQVITIGCSECSLAFNHLPSIWELFHFRVLGRGIRI
jgi:hypothetical protein